MPQRPTATTRMVTTLAALLPLVVAGSARGEDRGLPTLALLPVVADEVPEAEREAVSAAIRAEAERIGRFDVQPRDVTQANLTSAQQVGVACAFEALSCQASMGLLTGVDKLLVGRLVPEWSSSRLALRLVDVVAGTSEREAAQALAKSEPGRAVAIRGAVLAALAPDSTGSIVLDAAPRATFAIDGVVVPRAPVGEPLRGLAPGPHEVVVDDVTRIVVVVSGETAHVAGVGAIAAAPGGGGAAWAPWVAGGGAALALAGGAGAAGVALALETPIDHGARQAVRATGGGLLVATAVGVVAAGIGVVFMFVGGEP